ncbi:MAG: YceI family protein [Burkholderiales bacterium]
MNHLLYGILLGVAMVAPAAAADTYNLDPRHTFPVFEVSHYDYSLQRGRFNKTTGKITLDNTTKSGTIEITIDATSIDMGIDKWDEQMKSDAYFNTEQFPVITYRSDKVLFLGDKPVAAEGTLTLLGVGKPVNLTISGFKCGPNPINKKPMCGANVSTQIKRSEFGMTRALPGIGDDIKIMIAVEAFKE